MKKILIIHSIAWSHYAGSVFSKLYNLTQKANIEFLVIHLAKTSNQRKCLGEIDFSIHNYPYKILVENSLGKINWFRKIYYLLREVIVYKPDITITAGYSEVSIILTALLNKLLKKKNIVTSDTTIYDKERVWYKEYAKKILLKFFDYAFCVGTKQADYLKGLDFNPAKIFTTSWYAVDNKIIESVFSDTFNNRIKEINRLGFKEKNFIYVGRLSREKNVETLIKAFSNVKKDCNEWGLIIVGNGPERENLENLTKDLNLQDVYFVGSVSWREVAKYYALADVFVLPSISEPWGLVVNEAMVCELPVIVSNRAGASFDLVEEGKNGFTFNPYDQKQLENIMSKFVRGEVDAKEMGKKSKKLIDQYTPQNAAEQMFKRIELLIKE